VLPPPSPRHPASRAGHVSEKPPDSPSPPPLPQEPDAPTARASRTGGRAIPQCRNVTAYKLLDQVGEGQYGQVYKAQCRTTGRIAALKKLKMASERQGFPVTAIREIRILQHLKHPNIVDLIEIVTNHKSRDETEEHNAEATAEDDSVYMAFEYMEFDLQGLLYAQKNSSVRISTAHVKSYMKQLLEGVHFMHKNKVFHRDLKGSNILVDSRGHLKIADLGLARSWNERLSKYTPRVITLWFRPPELFMGAVKYSFSVDMWSVGCIFGELMLKTPLLPGKDEADQIEKIFRLLGTPKLAPGAPACAEDPDYTYDVWPGAASLPKWNLFEDHAPMPRLLQKRFNGNAHVARHGKPKRIRDKHFTLHAVDLLETMLALDPEKRITAEKALDHDYFWEDGGTLPPEELPQFSVDAAHDLDAKRQYMEMKEKREKEKRETAASSAR